MSDLRARRFIALQRGEAASSKLQSGQCPSSAPVPPEGTPRPGKRLLASRVRASDDDDDDDDDGGGGGGGGGEGGWEGEGEDAKQRSRPGFGPRWRKRGYDRAGSGTGRGL